MARGPIPDHPPKPQRVTIVTRGVMRCGEGELPAGAEVAIIDLRPNITLNFLVDGVRTGRLSEPLT